MEQVKHLQIRNGKVFSNTKEKPEPIDFPDGGASFSFNKKKFESALQQWGTEFVEVSNYDSLAGQLFGTFDLAKIKDGIYPATSNLFCEVTLVPCKSPNSCGCASECNNPQKQSVLSFQEEVKGEGVDDTVVLTSLNMILEDVEKLMKLCDKRNRLDLIRLIQEAIYNKTISVTYIKELMENPEQVKPTEKPRCSTCGKTKTELESVFCSNSFHLPSKSEQTAKKILNKHILVNSIVRKGVLEAMEEHAELKSSQARREAIQEAIAVISNTWPSHEDIISELEKLKQKNQHNSHYST